ncbi:MAG: hypothetical protein PWR24_1577 [Desulfonauticus sp.]|nr:MAG: Integron integrase [Desulfonauticus sp. 38_4375]MDK2922020.1 hypothetical protein [Desulfonauticus sp.]
MAYLYDVVRAKQNRRLPVALTKREVRKIFNHVPDDQKFMTMLIYGSGMRVSECVRLRVKDIDLEQNIVIIRSGKGDQDRITILPERLKDGMIRYIERFREIYTDDLKKNIAGVVMPGGLGRKYSDVRE